MKTMPLRSALSFFFAGLLVMSATDLSFANEPKKGEASKTSFAKPAPPKDIAAPPGGELKPEPKVEPTELQRQFCLSNAATATDAKVAWQAGKLVELEAQVKQRIAELEAKRAEYAEWLDRRNAAMRKAEDSVVAIYAKMRPEAAALQLAAMDDDIAAAMIAKFNARVASAILNEMEPGRAARLANAIVGPNAMADRKKS